MFCQKCGEQNREGAKFCNHCGASLSQMPGQQQEQPGAQQQSTQASAQAIAPGQAGARTLEQLGAAEQPRSQLYQSYEETSQQKTVTQEKTPPSKKKSKAPMIAAVAAILLIVGGGAGYGIYHHVSNQGNGSGNGDSENVLTIVCWNETDLEKMGELYEQETGLVYGEDIVYRNCGVDGVDASAKYANYLLSDDDIDLFIAEAGWILNYSNDDRYVMPLSELGIKSSEFENAYDYTIQVGTNAQGELMAASWQACPGGYVYNTDIAETYLGITSPEDMQAAVGDWASFEATAEQLYSATGGSVTMTATLGGLWQCYSTGNNAVWVKDGVLQTEAVKYFTGMAKKYADFGYVDASVLQWSDAWTDVGLEQKTMGYFYSSWCLPVGAQLQQNCGTEGNWRIVPGPQEYYWGGSWLCVSSQCDSKDMAEDFIRFFTVNTESMQLYAETYGDFVNNRVAMQNVVDAGTNANPLLGGQDPFAVLLGVADSITMDATITKYDQNLKDTFVIVLTDYIDESTDEIVDIFVEAALASNQELTSD